MKKGIEKRKKSKKKKKRGGKKGKKTWHINPARRSRVLDPKRLRKKKGEKKKNEEDDGGLGRADRKQEDRHQKMRKTLPARRKKGEKINAGETIKKTKRKKGKVGKCRKAI